MPLKVRFSDHHLEENLATFASLLREEGLPVGTTELFDALSALEKIDLSSRNDFKIALQATLVKSRADQAFFSKLFDLFFTPEEHYKIREEKVTDHRKIVEEKINQAGREMQFKGESLELSFEELQQYSSLSHEQRSRLQDFMYKTETGKNVEPRFRPLLETVVKSHLRYCRARHNELTSQACRGESDGAGLSSGSGDESLREMDIQAINTAEIPVAEYLLQRLSAKLAVQILRRRRSGPRSGLLDLRRSLRENMSYGGVIFNLKYKPKHRSRQQILLLCDVSASMKQYSFFAIHFLNGLREVVRGLSCFSFSDSLENLTPELKNRAGLQNLMDRVIRQSNNWGGGTDIGSSLKQLSRVYPDYLNARTTVIIVSDTKTVSLDQALKELGKLNERVKRVIWLNPLPVDQWADYRSVHAVSSVIDMWPCSTIAQLEEVLSGSL